MEELDKFDMRLPLSRRRNRLSTTHGIEEAAIRKGLQQEEQRCGRLFPSHVYFF
jgi:hypothetical protein